MADHDPGDLRATRSAATALALYQETEDSRLRRMAQIAERRAQGSLMRERKGRPTKRERRQIIRFRARG
jgi:ribosome-associated heat shock protein Hsp15